MKIVNGWDLGACACARLCVYYWELNPQTYVTSLPPWDILNYLDILMNKTENDKGRGEHIYIWKISVSSTLGRIRSNFLMKYLALKKVLNIHWKNVHMIILNYLEVSEKIGVIAQ